MLEGSSIDKEIVKKVHQYAKGKKKKPIVKSYNDCCTDTTIEFTVKLHMGVLPNLVSKKIDNNINHLEFSSILLLLL